jgi:uncharacterized protein
MPDDCRAVVAKLVVMAEQTPHRPHSPNAVDVAVLCREGATLHGQWALAAMQRLVSGLAATPADACAAWSAQAVLKPVTGSAPEMWLHLKASATVLLQCQRCLQDMTEPVVVNRRIRFVRSEAEAARLDEESEDDVLALMPRLDLQALFEDELILALPLVPMHGNCPQPLSLAATTAPQAAGDALPHPFAVLKGLKTRQGQGGGA